MIVETPNARKTVWMIQPVINPTIVANPYFFPWTTLCNNTEILSGPGEIANRETVVTKDINYSILI